MDVGAYVKLSANAPTTGLRQLPPPEYVEATKDYPKKITGLERRYLEALQKNVTARKEYNALLQQSTQQPSAPSVNVQKTHLSEQVELLRLQKRHEELQMFQRYLNNLSNGHVEKADFLDLKRSKEHEPESLPSDYQHYRDDIDQAKDSIDALARRLEIEVIRTKHQVDLERKFLSEAERDVDAIPTSAKHRNRVRALAMAKDELVIWMEDNMAASQANEKSMADDELKGPQAGSSISQLQNEIMEEYQIYIGFRGRMLELISDLNTYNQRPPRETQASEAKIRTLAPSFPPTCPSFLPFVQNQIGRTRKLYQCHRRQVDHLTGLISEEHSKTTSELARLADESHLLPSYPMLAQQDRFKHATAAIAPKSPFSDAKPGDGENEMTRWMQAWAFAADAVKKATDAIVAGHLVIGNEAVEDGERSVSEIQDLLGYDRELGQEQISGRGEQGDGEDGEEDLDEDVWAVEAAMASRKPAFDGKKGPWSGLQGNVGLLKQT
jgi:hypothetical protein